MLRVFTQLVGPSLSAVIDGVSDLARLNVNDLYTARLRYQVGRTARAAQNAIGRPDFAVVIRRDHAVRPRRVRTGLNADEGARCKLAYGVITGFDLIDRFVSAVGQEVEPDLRIDEADVERIETARHGDGSSFLKGLLRESRSMNHRCAGCQ